MNVLHVCSDLEPEKGGVSAAVLGITQHGSPNGAYIRVCYGGRPREDLLPDTASLSYQYTKQSLSALALARQVEWADVVHIHAVWDPLQRKTIDLCIRHGKPTVLSTHGMLDQWCLNHKRLKKKLFLELVMRRRLKRATLMHATCSFEANMVRALGFGRPIKIIPLGVSSTEFEHHDPDDEAPMPALGRDRLRPFILFLSRLHPIKGIELLIEGFAKSTMANDVDLIIAGPGDSAYMDELRSLCQHHSVDQSTFFPGMISGDEKGQALRRALCFVLPSHHENFSIATLEALASGTPAIVSDQVGLHEEITNANAGRVTQLDAQQIATSIRELASDVSLREQLGANAKELVRNGFYWEHLQERWQSVYESAITGN